MIKSLQRIERLKYQQIPMSNGESDVIINLKRKDEWTSA